MPTEWIAQLKARAEQPPRFQRAPLRGGPHGLPIGSIEASLAGRIVAAQLPLMEAAGGWHVLEPLDVSLALLADWLHEEGLGGRWRNELLAVTTSTGDVIGMIERAAVRPLGIKTFAVHLVGRSRSGDFWVQQRALDKATDPGCWDTLMGGQIAAGEALRGALERETWEEAGLALEHLEDLMRAGSFDVRRPVSDGYMIEHIDVFEAVLPDGMQPLNQDTEVERFECLSAAQLLPRLQADAFTLEAALILVASLQRSGQL